MINGLLYILVVCIIVWLIEKFGNPAQPWRNIFRGIALVFAIVVLLSLLVPLPLPVLYPRDTLP